MNTNIKTIILLLLSFILISCASEGDDVVPACSEGSQGFSIGNDGMESNFNDDEMHVDLITGGSEGDYYHVYSTVAPFIDVYSYAVNDGDTSTFSEIWNTTDGSFFMYNGVAYYTDNTGVESLTMTTEAGGNSIDDNIKFSFSGTAVSEDGETVEINAEACLTLDSVTEIPASCSAVAISYSVNAGPTTYIEDLVTAEIFNASYYTVGKKVYDIWTDSGVGFYFHSSASHTGDISNFVDDWRNDEGATLVIPGLDLASGTFTFTTVQEASAVGDLVTIEFEGTFGSNTIDGVICTVIDVLH